jgi:hypothetical protein
VSYFLRLHNCSSASMMMHVMLVTVMEVTLTLHGLLDVINTGHFPVRAVHAENLKVVFS